MNPKDTDVYAKWISSDTQQYSLVFETNDGTLAAVSDAGPVASGGKVYAGTKVTVTYSAGMNEEVSAWYVNGIVSATKGESVTVTVDSDTTVKAVADYYFGDISNLISRSGGITSKDTYAMSWDFKDVQGYAVVGDYVYVMTSSGYLYKVYIYDGSIVKSYYTASADSSTSGANWPTVGDGMVLVPLSGTVFDLDLNPLYRLGVTSQNAFYNDGYWYINPSRTLYCYSAADEDTSVGDNVQTAKWSTDITSYIDSMTIPTTLAFGKNYVAYLGTGGATTDKDRYIVTLDKETGDQVDSYLMTEIYNSYWNYGYLYSSEGMITVRCQWTTLWTAPAYPTGDVVTIYRVYVDDDGNIDDDSGLAVNLGLQSYGSSVVVYEGLGYVWTSGYFIVLDLSSGMVLAKEECGTANAVRTNLSLAVGEDGIVRGYVNPYPYDSTHGIYAFEYTIATNGLTTYQINVGGHYQYPNADFIKIGQEGQILFTNDSGYLMCISKAATVTIVYSDGTTEERAVSINGTLGVDPAVESYSLNAFTTYDPMTPVTKDITVYATLKTWYVNEGTLYITDLFDMQDYSKTSKAPWADSEFTSVILEEGVTYIGAYAFYACVDLESVVLSSSVARIGDYAFYGCASLTVLSGVSDDIVLGDSALEKSGLSYYVLYKANGGKYTKAYYSYGSLITAPVDPSKDGYTFEGWNGLPSTMPLRNVSVSAVFEANSYTITFDTDGGSAVAPITQDYGTAITAPAAPTKTGYTFAGWDSLPKTMPAENVTVKALWTADTHSVTVKYVYADGTEASAPATETVEYNAKYSIESPAIVGYYTDKTTVADTMGTEDVTVTVTYLKDTFAYTVGGKVSQSGVNTVVDISLERTSGHTDIQNARLLVIAMYEGGIAVNVCPSATLTDGTGSEQVVVSSNDLVSVTVQVVSGIPSGAYDNYGSYLYDATAVTVTVAAGENGTVSVKEPIEVSSGTTISTEGDKVTVGETVVTATPSEGYAFSEWTVTDASGKVYEKTVVDEDITVTAKFEAIAKTAE